ncbi:hypothetical protein B296_00016068 [Ensete ventricosum]|uniref:Uncharacterized protein n=1 Tax=Ensete ventricosum TaxID=4639 RepID=A0A426XT88_ENSVE|nr:hypothetical protein B296_00016068 [Ensete ventricosum]
MCVSKLVLDESLGYQHMGAMYYGGRSQIASTSEFHGGGLIIQRYDWSSWRVGLLQCSHSFKGVWQVRGQGRVVKRGEEVMTSLVGLSYPKVKCRYHRGGNSMEPSIPCSHGARALVVKRTEEVENAEANSKYQDRA